MIPSQMIQTKVRWELESHSLVVINEAPNTHPPRSVKKKKKVRQRPGTFTLPVSNSLSDCAYPRPGYPPTPTKDIREHCCPLFFQRPFPLVSEEDHSGSQKVSLNNNKDPVTR